MSNDNAEFSVHHQPPNFSLPFSFSLALNCSSVHSPSRSTFPLYFLSLYLSLYFLSPYRHILDRNLAFEPQHHSTPESSAKVRRTLTVLSFLLSPYACPKQQCQFRYDPCDFLCVDFRNFDRSCANARDVVERSAVSRSGSRNVKRSNSIRLLEFVVRARSGDFLFAFPRLLVLDNVVAFSMIWNEYIFIELS
ncbi:hypothetical protein RJT34_17861 [Clitoria ternatea]|uniref:Uncharacterized protein n=1 Tax=Clitoria ternatea TaxID=43366 RepID=A0AAN9JB88_CLITE